MNAKVPKVASPDLEMPSAELRKEAYELAFSVWEMEPWIDFIEEQVLAIRFADGAERFLSVMGRNGEHRAIALYPDAATYWRIRGIEGGASIRAQQPGRRGQEARGNVSVEESAD